MLGANGFIGSHLVDKLAGQGDQIRAFDRFDTPRISFENKKDVEIVSGNFLNRSDLSNALEGMEYVFHLVSTTTPATSENDPLIDIDTNVRMTIELLQECVEHKIKRLVFPSTGGAVYGDIDTTEPIGEDTNPQPVSPYAIGKLTIEHYLRYFSRRFGLSTLTYRVSNPYGERHSPVNRQGVIPIFLEHIANNQPITILGDGSMVRDYVYVQDVASLIAKSYKNAKEPLYNLGSGQGVSLNGLIEAIRQVTQKDIKSERQPKPPTFVQNVVLDISRFKNEFGIQPETSLEEGIRKTWDYVLSTHKAS